MEPTQKIKVRANIRFINQIIAFVRANPRLISGLVALLLFLILKMYFFDVVIINNNDMRESYFKGDAVLIKKSFNQFNRNDVLYFEYPVQDSPIKTTFLFQRVIGLPGDSVEIDDKIVFVNNAILTDSKLYKQNYFIHLDSSKCDSTFGNKFSFLEGGKIDEDLEYGFSLTDAQFDAIEKEPCIKSIKVKQENKENMDENCFPNSQHYRWNRDHYGKLYIPKKNDVLYLDTINLNIYSSVILYEKNKLDIRNDSIVINSVVTNTYLVKGNYYFMMGDNRDNTVDSRIWGYLPESKIKGKLIYTLKGVKP